MKKLIKFKPSAKTYFDIAEDKYDCGDLSGSAQYFFKAHEKHKDIDSLIALGEVYAEMGQPEEGLKYLFRALDIDPDDAETCHSIAQCFLEMDDEETAFFYFQPRMTVNRFKHILEESDREETEFVPIRVLEKNDEITLGIAMKLLASGDAVYARELLRTIKSSSDQYATACNLLALSALELDEPKEALEYAQKALEAGGDIDSRCNMMLAYFALGEEQNAREISGYLEGQRLSLSARKTVSLAYIRMGEAEKATGHLRILYESDHYCRDTAVSYALACYKTGDNVRAKQIIVETGRAYPGDLVVREIAAAMARGEELSLFPMLNERTAAEWLTEIDERLTVARDNISNSHYGKHSTDETFLENIGLSEMFDFDDEFAEISRLSAVFDKDLRHVGSDSRKEHERNGNSGKLVANGNRDEIATGKNPAQFDDYFDDREFVDKIKWLFQSHFTTRQGKAAIMLGRFPRWHEFLREQLLDNSMDISTKKACLCALLLGGVRGNLGLVTYGMYSRLKVRYPEGMDDVFRTAYCLAFSSFALSDSCFEGRLLAAAKKLLKKYTEAREMVLEQNAVGENVLTQTERIVAQDTKTEGDAAKNTANENTVTENSADENIEKITAKAKKAGKGKAEIKLTEKKKANSAKKTDLLFETDILAAALFHFARHKQINGTHACSQLFACDHQKLKDFLSLLGVK